MRFPLAALFSLLPLAALAQTPAANVITNGGFERSFERENLWDGVDSENYLTSPQANAEAITESGGVRSMPLPVSVAVADLNGDGAKDLLTTDADGYFRAYFNSGSKQEPKFTHAEIPPIFLSRFGDARVPKINLFDWNGQGLADLAVGNYQGEFFLLRNQGTVSVPEFRQPADVGKAPISTSKKGLWANLLAPAVYDLNKDGKIDLLLGEGSYSANSIHLLLNKGTNSIPAFDETQHYFLAFGDGREQLTPTLADYNGDGFMDLLVSDRQGRVGVYLNPGASWKPGVEFKFSNDVSFASSTSLGSMVSVCAVDLNGDDLFDLVLGKTNGRIAVAYNRGTKGSPKFDSPVDLKGVNIWARNSSVPSGWDVDFGYARGNAYSDVTVVNAALDGNAAPPEGTACLKVAYWPSPNQIFKVPALTFSGNANYLEFFNENGGGISHFSWRLPSNVFVMQKTLPLLNVGKNYILSMKTKGSGVSNLTWTLSCQGVKEGVKKIVRGERNSANVEGGDVKEEKRTTGSMSAGAGWNTFAKTIHIEKFGDSNLSDVPKTNAVLEIRATFPNTKSTLYLDDIQLTPAP